MTINKDNHKVVVDGEEIKLTPIEFDILYLLASNPGVCSAPTTSLRRSGMKRCTRPTIQLWYISAGCGER